MAGCGELTDDVGAGVTRDSILQLVRSQGGMQVSERQISIREIGQASDPLHLRKKG